MIDAMKNARLMTGRFSFATSGWGGMHVGGSEAREDGSELTVAVASWRSLPRNTVYSFTFMNFFAHST